MTTQEIEYGNCEVCNIQAPLSRKYYSYDIKCDCCNSKNDDHFEIVRHCKDCTPKPPEKVKVIFNIKPKEKEL